MMLQKGVLRACFGSTYTKRSTSLLNLKGKWDGTFQAKVNYEQKGGNTWNVHRTIKQFVVIRAESMRQIMLRDVLVEGLGQIMEHLIHHLKNL